MLRIGWIVLGLLVAGLVASGAGILVAQSNTTVPGVAVAAEPPAPGARVTPAPVPPAVPVPPRRPAGPVIVSGIRRNETIACEGRSISISGASNTVVLTGRCDHVNISGVQNSVRIAEAAEIVVSGMDNDVVYSGNPRLDQSGLRNRVHRG